MTVDDRLAQVRRVRAELQAKGPRYTRPFEGDFERVALPLSDADRLRDVLVGAGATVVIEVGLAYGSSALAIGEALCLSGAPEAHHIVIDPFQSTSYRQAGWQALRAAGLESQTRFTEAPSSIALARLVAESFVAHAAFVDGSHRFHEVFVDLYFLRKLVRPGGLIILDDAGVAPVGTALNYFDTNLGWERVEMAGRLTARRLPLEMKEPDFTDFRPF